MMMMVMSMRVSVMYWRRSSVIVGNDGDDNDTQGFYRDSVTLNTEPLTWMLLSLSLVSCFQVSILDD